LDVFFALQEFVKAFKNCRTEDADTRAAGLTGYLAQIKEDGEKEYQHTAEKNLKAAKIVELHEIIGFLEGALLWRSMNYTTDFPDIQEKDIAQELLEIEGNIKLQYIKSISEKDGKDSEQELEKILQKLKEMKICPLWHQKVCKRLELTKEATQFLQRLKQGGDSNEAPGNTKTGEKYKGEVEQQIFDQINKTRLKVAEEKEKMILDKTISKVSDSFEIPSGYIIEGTYFDQRLKEKTNELEAFRLRNGDLPIIRALKEIIEVVNLLFNTPSEPFFFVWHFKDLTALVKHQQDKVQDKRGNDDLAIEILVFMMRLTDLFEDILDWKETEKMRHGDVKNSEIDELLRAMEIEILIYEEYMIHVTRLSEYMSGTDYESKMFVLNKELDILLKVRLAANNVECVERYDDLVERLEGIIEELKQVYMAKEKNYQALRNVYEAHRSKITKGIYNQKERNRQANQFQILVEDLNKRFGSEFDNATRKNYLHWVNQLVTLRIGGHQDVETYNPFKVKIESKEVMNETI